MATTVRACTAGGGIPTQDGKSSTGVSCSGGSHDGEEVTMIALKNPLDTLEVNRVLQQEMAKARAESPAVKKP
jgi:hypothetical protein